MTQFSWAQDSMSDKAKMGKVLKVVASPANCTPMFCNCLPPKTPRDKACSSRNPDKKCHDKNLDSKEITCEFYCKHVPNCQTKIDPTWDFKKK